MAFLGFTIDSSQTVRAKMDLDKMTGATVQAENAANRLRNASQREAAALQTVARQAEASAAALRSQAAASDRMIANQRRNLMFQLNDVAVSLASGMPAYMVFAQQGSQISQIYEGGVVPALRETAKMAGEAALRFGPFIALAGAAAIGVAALRDEIRRTTGEAVTFGDMATAAWEMASSRILELAGTSADALRQWWGGVWESIGDITASEFNGIARGFEGSVAEAQKAGAYIQAIWGASVEHAKNAWGGLPSALGDIMYRTAQNVLEGLEGLINEGVARINDLVQMLPENMRGGFQVGQIDFGDLTNPFAGQANDFARRRAEINASFGAGIVGANNDFNRRMEEIRNTDYFATFADRAGDIAAARTELEGLGAAGSAANDNFKTLGTTMSDAARAAKAEWDFYRGTFTGFFGDLKSGLQEGRTFWEALGDAGANALDKIASRAMEMATNGIFDMLFGAVMGGITGGLGGGMFGKSASTPLGFGGTAGFYPAFPSFAGGGWTGNGPRTGGLDGMGGFLAMMHPREIVRDTTRGPADQNQSNDNYRRGDVHLHINGSNLSQAEMTAAIADALDRYDRFTLPGRVNELKGNSMVVNG